MAKDKRTYEEKKKEFLMNTLRDEFGITGTNEEILAQVEERFEFLKNNNLLICQLEPPKEIGGVRADEVYRQLYSNKQTAK